MVDVEPVDLVLRVESEVDATDVLIGFIRGHRAEDVSIGAAVGAGNKLGEVLSDSVERGCREFATEIISALRPRFTCRYRNRGSQSCSESGCSSKDPQVGSGLDGDGNGGRGSLERTGIHGEVAAELGRRRNADVAAGLRRDLPGALIGAEEEELVLEDRTADGAARNVLVILGDVRNAGRGVLVEVGGVEEGVAIELEDIAVEVVGALLDGGADDAAGVAVVLGVERAFDEVELVDGVEVRRDDEGVERDVVGVGAVDEKARTAGSGRR